MLTASVNIVFCGCFFVGGDCGARAYTVNWQSLLKHIVVHGALGV